MHRTRVIRGTYLAVALTVVVLGIVACGSAYIEWADLSLTAPLNKQGNFVTQLGFLLALLIPIPIGFSAGGWIWARIAKRWFGVTRHEMEQLFFSGKTRIKWLDRANRRAIDQLFRT